MKHLCILDLDNTLIYTSNERELPAKVLLHYSGYTIYERPHARDLVRLCQEKCDTAVFTTAVRDYAENVCRKLGLKPIKIFSREDCRVADGRYVKSVPDHYFDQYNSLIIIDDMPEIWDAKSHNKCQIISVSPFMGSEDDELLKIINQSFIQ